MPEVNPSGPSPRSADTKTLESHFRMAPVYAGQLAWCLALTAILTALCLVIGFTQALPSARALSFYLLLVTGVLAALWRMVALRADVSLEREARVEAQRKAAIRAKTTGKESLFSGEPEGVPRHWSTEFKLEGYAYVHQRIVLLAVCVAAGALAFIYLIKPVPRLAESKALLSVGALELVIAFACILASRYFALVGPKGVKEATALSGWLRGALWLAGFGAISLFLGKVTEFRYPIVELYVTRVILGWTLLCALELAVRAFVGLVGARRPYDEVEVPIQIVSIDLIFGSANPLQSLSAGLEKYLGISLQASWGLRFIGRAFFPLVFFLGAVFWGMSCLEVVHPHEQGILEHLGRYTGKPLEPGLHVKWPWPFDRIYHYPATKVAEMKLGFSTTDRRLPLVLWTKKHAEEYSLILDGGNDLLSLNAYVYYRIKDVEQYAYQVENPDAALEALAYRELMLGILDHTLDDLMTVNRTVLPALLERRIQEAADRGKLGIEIVKLAFVGLHPPLAAADAYQDVVSAQIAAETLRDSEDAFRAVMVPAAEEWAYRQMRQAVAESFSDTSAALGQAAAGEALLKVCREDPALFGAERNAEVFEDVFKGHRLIVLGVDTSNELIYDLRRGLPPFGMGRRSP